ncbi:MAG: DNA methyltransferase, partial [Anaerolineae bacterium]
MYKSVQLSLFGEPVKPRKQKLSSEWGTFKDSLRAPVHRWFTYPAGFSYKAVEHAIQQYGVLPDQTIYDPFMGSGTTNVVAKTLGINSYGVEAHPFVYQIAKTKLDWSIEREETLAVIKHVYETLPGMI